jgi:hypothetical protein
MSGMANEMAQRMAEDVASSVSPAQEPGGVPGNAGAVPPSAGTSNTDTGTQGGPPDSIPYSRFKEVNDRLAGLRGFEELSQYGYDADSLRRLASFEQQYQADPIGVWKSMAVNLDLPQEVLDVVNAFQGADTGTPQQAEVTADGRGRPGSALSAEDRARLEYVDQMKARDESTAREQVLDRVVAAWDDMDRQDGVRTSRRTQLTWIAAMAGGQQNGGQAYRTVEDLASAARSARMEERDLDLGAAVLSGNANRGAPPALPGSLPTPASPIRFGSLREASQAAEADILAGRLSPLQE